MINKGNILFLFLVFLNISVIFCDSAVNKINNNQESIKNIMLLNNRLYYELETINYVNNLLNNEELNDGIYTIKDFDVDIIFMDDYISVYIFNLDMNYRLMIENNIVYDYYY